MEFISHRGYWKQPQEKNTVIAFRRSFDLGFGAELDVRDYHGKLVVSHDIASEECLEFSGLIEVYKEYDKSLVLAINIKSDGLYDLLSGILVENQIENYFVFDMAIPDGLGYLNRKIRFFTRQSEYEPTPSFYDRADGIWMDEFNDHWIDKQIISQHLDNGKKVCLVSPELHQRDHMEAWHDYKDLMHTKYKGKLFLCTDLPAEAKEYFYD